MKVELSVEELKIIEMLGNFYVSSMPSVRVDAVVFLERVDGLIEQAEELEEVDLSDCGDACKL